MGQSHSHHEHGGKRDLKVDAPAHVWDKEARRARRMGRGFANKTSAILTSAEWWKPGLDVLDFGCGPGQVLLEISKDCARITGLDISPAMIDMFQKQIESMGIQDMATSGVLVGRDGSDLEGRAHDVVICTFVLHHCKEEDRDAIIARLGGAVKPRGHLVIGEIEATHRGLKGLHTTSEEELREWFTKNGFQDLEFKRYWQRVSWFSSVKALVVMGVKK